MFTAFNKLSRHTKVAVFVAPILLILGWAASDIYLESQAMKTRFFEMEPEAGFCDVMAKNCILRSGDFKMSLYIEDGKTTLNSTFPLDTATLFLVDEQDQPTVFRMGMKDSPYYWYQVTPLLDLIQTSGSKQKIRLVATVKGGQYIAEFYSRTVGNRVVD
jgi:hypothetical protein